MSPRSQVPLAPLTTLGLGGPAERLVEAHEEESLVAAVREADARGGPVLVLAGGSNVVVGDAGVRGTVVLVRTRGVRISGATVTAAAGEPWEQFVATTVDAGLAGLECLAGIPGTVGATPVQNVGAYGQEVASTVRGVRVLDRGAGSVRTLSAEDCGFGYRDSMLKRLPDRFVVLEVAFGLCASAVSAPVRYAELAGALGVDVGARVPLAEVPPAVLALRGRKGMLVRPDDPDSRSVGSFFTNPVVDADRAARVTNAAGARPPAWPAGEGRVKLSAAWLVQHAGFSRGFSLPGAFGARVSSKHALALVNAGGTTQDLLALARHIRDGVLAAFGVELVPEPVVVGAPW